MRLLFVRHGHPDYTKDCLTELGHRQAEAAADRLASEPFVRCFSSTLGRAVETAEHIAARHDLPVEQLDFMRELGWGTIEGEPLPERGHPWFLADRMVREGEDITSLDWAEKEPMCRNSATVRARIAAEGIDALLEELGYRREGSYYRVLRENDDTVLIVSHGGSSSAVLAHLLGLAFPYVCATIHPDFTSVSTIRFVGKPGELIVPWLDLLNDARHIEGIDADAVIGQ